MILLLSTLPLVMLFIAGAVVLFFVVGLPTPTPAEVKNRQQARPTFKA